MQQASSKVTGQSPFAPVRGIDRVRPRGPAAIVGIYNKSVFRAFPKRPPSTIVDVVREEVFLETDSRPFTFASNRDPCTNAPGATALVAAGAAKLAGIAQIRRRHAALFQLGILRRDQSPLADYLQVTDEATREELRSALRQRTVGIESFAELLPFQPDQLL